MKVISLWQPWATLLVTGEKTIETRHWYTSHRGPLLIHAAKRWARDERELCEEWPFKPALEAHGFNVQNMPLGAIVGRVKLVDCVQVKNLSQKHPGILTAEEQEFGNFMPDRYAWICRDFEMLKDPIPAKGQQGFWDYKL